MHGCLFVLMILTKKMTSSYFTILAAALIGSFNIALTSGFDGVSQANAQQVEMSTFCEHYHNWALSGTTGVIGPPCSEIDYQEQSSSVVDQYDFCFHDHKFALNWTSIVVGDSSVEEWCNDYSDDIGPVTRDIFDFHYHNNAGTGTTGPIQ